MKPRYHQTAANLAAAVYEETDHDIRVAVQGLYLPSSTAEIYRVGDEVALIVPTGDVVYVGFRGTVTESQWLSDLRAIKTRLPIPIIGKCHLGFSNGWKKLEREVVPECAKWHNLGHKLVVYGHSRGAALAILAALQLYRYRHTPVEIHLFGCPRTLNRAAAKYYNTAIGHRTIRWVANNDTVCRVPFAWMGYAHVGEEYYFDSADQLHINPGTWYKLRQQIIGRLKGGLFDGISDHDKSHEYVRLIARRTLEISGGKNGGIYCG